MYQFKYNRCASVEEAQQLHAGSTDATYLAGGMTLIPSLKLRLASPDDVIDLGSIASLMGVNNNGHSVTIGATTTHATVAGDGTIPALAHLASGIGDAQVRNRGTIGGSLANNDPAADYPAALLGLNATIHTSKRSIAADDFIKGLFETALDDGEIIVSVEFPIPSRAAYTKFPNPASRYAIVGVMVAETGGGIRVGVTGAGPCAYRESSMEAALNQEFSTRSLDSVAVDAADLNQDMHASNEYRAHLVKVMAKRAVDQLTE